MSSLTDRGAPPLWFSFQTSLSSSVTERSFWSRLISPMAASTPSWALGPYAERDMMVSMAKVSRLYSSGWGVQPDQEEQKSQREGERSFQGRTTFF